MRVVERAGRVRRGARVGAGARRASAFGDDRVLLEKYLARPRHIEVQIFADSARQRRASLRARLLGPAPPPEGDRGGAGAGLTPTRCARAWREAAVAAARAVGYVGAGTVEFIVDGDAFYFMEMNTRLQVEHPVTEMITGLDLVEWQLRVAAGEPLPLRAGRRSLRAATRSRRGSTPKIRRAISCRDRHAARSCVCPRPTPTCASIPACAQGDAVGVHYDPMIAKLIAWGEDRAAAHRGARAALGETRVAGVTTNRDFLLRAAAPARPSPRATSIPASSSGIATRCWRRGAASGAALAAASSSPLLRRRRRPAQAPRRRDPHSPWRRRDGWRLGRRRVAGASASR